MTEREQLIRHVLWRGVAELARRAEQVAVWPAAWDEQPSLSTEVLAIIQAATTLAASASNEQPIQLVRALATITRSATYDNGETRPVERQRSQFTPPHPLSELTLTRDFLLPDKAPALTEAEQQTSYAKLWQGLDTAFKTAAAGGCEAWLAEFKRYTWAVPAADGISLYEQTRMAAALGVCLQQSGLDAAHLNAALDPSANETTDPGLLDTPVAGLVKGDLSGVQDFLYLLTSAGAARGLRGRSFYLQLLTETIAQWVLRESGELPPVNLIYAGGGHFYLLLPPNVSDWEPLRARLDEKLWAAHQGDLGCTLASVSLTARDLLADGLSKKWAELAAAASGLKQRKWLPLGSARMFETLFHPQDHGTTPEKMCQVCHNEWDKARGGTLQDDARKCGRCVGFEALGRKLRDVQQIVRFHLRADRALDARSDWQAILASFGVWLEVVDGGSDKPASPTDAQTVTVERIAEGNFEPCTTDERGRFEWDGLPASYTWRLLGQATPFKRDAAGQVVFDSFGKPDIAEFSDLAEAADGAQWLGVLRMDVDDLGEVLRAGLQGHASLARLSTLSESLRLFFEGWVPQLCERYKTGPRGDRLYLIYAGGDDLFVVGAWSALPRLAREIEKDFAQFVGGRHVTVSAGIAIEHAKYPLYQLAEAAGHALDVGAKGLQTGKDAVSFLGQAISWERFAMLESWQTRLIKMLEATSQPLPRSFLTRLGEIHASYSENARKQYALAASASITRQQVAEQIHYARWHWRLVYQLSQARQRNMPHANEIEALQEALARDDSLIGLLHVLARWAELQMRKPQTNE
jgi:CRISPR-associated protein Csm1